MDKIKRCAWVPENNPLYQRYHDEEWGVPVHEDRTYFEFLILEGAQAGLSWETVLKKREGYRKTFHDFDVEKCAKMSDEELEETLQNPEIIRNRLKVFSVRKNARVFIDIQKEFGSFDRYIRSLVGEAPVCHNRQTISEVPATSPESDKLSKDLKKRGMTFVGSTIVYAFMQATGLVNNHTKDCFRFKE